MAPHTPQRSEAPRRSRGTPRYRVAARVSTALLALVAVLLVACGSKEPDEDLVRQDFDRALGSARAAGLYSIVSVSSGGDSSTLERRIKFSVEPTQTRVVGDGLLKGLSFKSGEALSCGEAVLIYQRRDRAWALASQSLARPPQAGATGC